MSFKRVVVFMLLAAFAQQEAEVLLWVLSLGYNVLRGPALWGLAISTISLAVTAAVLWAPFALYRRRRQRRDDAYLGPGPAAGAPSDQAAVDPSVPLDSSGQMGSGASSADEKGGSDEWRPERR